MGLVRLLVLGGLAWMVWSFYRRYRAAREAPRPTHQDKLIKCSVCGVFMPQNDARVTAGGEYRCAQHVGDPSRG